MKRIKRKEMRKRIIVLMLCIAMMVQIVGQHQYLRAETVSSNEVSENEEALESETVPEKEKPSPNEALQITDANGNTAEVSFTVDSQWDRAYNGKITIKNISEKVIENWTLSFETTDTLSNFYNATLISQEDGVYHVENCGWNRDIAPGQSVSFGFSGAFLKSMDMPEDYKFLSVLQEVEGEAAIEWRMSSEWGNGFTGEVTITNNGTTNIEDWRVSFELVADTFNVWNATLVSKENTCYTVRSCDYNSVIRPGESVKFGLQAGGNWEQVPTLENLRLEHNAAQKADEEEMKLTEEEKATLDSDFLEVLFAENDSYYGVTQNVTLKEAGASGSVITWESSNEQIVGRDGHVTRPESSCSVTLTAIIQNGDVSLTKAFELWVIKEEREQEQMPEQISYEDIQSWNAEGGLEMYSHDGGETMDLLYGRFTEGKMETDSEAVCAVWGIGDWLGLNWETDSFRVYRRISSETGTVFRMGQYYKGVYVIGGGIIVSSDADGNSDYVRSNYQKGLNVSTEPVHSADEVKAILAGGYEQCQVNTCELVLYEKEDEYRLAWQMEAELDSTYYNVIVEDSTGEILKIIKRIIWLWI